MIKRKTIRKTRRKCIVCGKLINITLYQDGHYKNGHFFKVIKVPVGKGEYKKVKTTKIFGKKCDIVKWTGKEKEVEYWECNDCFNEAEHHTWLEQTIEKLYGKRCKDYLRSCACCHAWGVYNTIIELSNEK